VQGRSRASSHEGIAGKQLGGRFAGLIRRLPVEERAQYHEIKAKQGLKAPIDALQKRRGSSSWFGAVIGGSNGRAGSSAVTYARMYWIMAAVASRFSTARRIVEGVHARERHPGCGEERHEVARDHFHLYPFLPPQQFLSGVELHEPCFARHPEPFVDGCDFIEPIERVSLAARELNHGDGPFAPSLGHVVERAEGIERGLGVLHRGIEIAEPQVALCEVRPHARRFELLPKRHFDREEFAQRLARRGDLPLLDANDRTRDSW